MNQEYNPSSGSAAQVNRALDKLTYVYIASRGHSGSTLLERLLDNHSEFTAMGEIEKLSLQYIRHREGKYPGRCSCGLVPMECPSWRKVAAAIAKEFQVDMTKRPFDFRVSDIGLEEDWGTRAPWQWASRRYHRVARTIGYGTGGGGLVKDLMARCGARFAQNRYFVAGVLAKNASTTAVVDSSKDHLGMRDLYDYGSGRTKVIFLTRDVRGNVWSSLKHRRMAAAEVARDWVKDNERILGALKGVQRSDWLHVRYEDLCADPAAACRTICNFAGYNFEHSMIENDSSEHHTIGGNKIRYSRVEAIKQDLGWAAGLTADQIRDVESEAGSFAASLGYSF